MAIDPSHAQRRRRLADGIASAGGGVAVVAAAPPRPRNADSDHPYRQDSTFAWLTGFDEPGAWLFVAADGRSTLLCRAKNPATEVWDGVVLGPEAAPGALGVEHAEDVARLDAVALELLGGEPAVWCGFAAAEPPVPRVGDWLAALRAQSRSGSVAPGCPGLRRRGSSRRPRCATSTRSSPTCAS